MCHTRSKHFLVVGVALEGLRQSFSRFKDVTCKLISDILQENESLSMVVFKQNLSIQSLFQPAFLKKPEMI